MRISADAGFQCGCSPRPLSIVPLCRAVRSEGEAAHHRFAKSKVISFNNQQNQMTINNESPFGENIHIYSRKEALADGEQVDVSKFASEASIKFPVFFTRMAYGQSVAVSEDMKKEDEIARLRHVLKILRNAIEECNIRTDRLRFRITINDEGIRVERVLLMAVCGPIDVDDPRPAITVMLPQD
jgi:hypothetical protein